jgi:hypothetical protein
LSHCVDIAVDHRPYTMRRFMSKWVFCTKSDVVTHLDTLTWTRTHLDTLPPFFCFPRYLCFRYAVTCLLFWLKLSLKITLR